MDANVYLAYFLGEKDEELVDWLFRTSLGCRFSITTSLHVYREVQHVCGDRSVPLVQYHLEMFQAAKKLQNVSATAVDLEWATRQNVRSGRLIGLNDWIHIRLASISSDVLVSNDRMLLQLAAPWVRRHDLGGFIKFLKT
ncbi:type II toxin-antitoxin system VapC family toxin [Candidatus Micrarchaeota archaeon]|nr:type II toxin-antitoxin system VapC family toxin [Candidatus Micrarchaeota archaeon]